MTVLNGLNVEVQAGKTLALVGESGCGKSTLIGLLEQFYKPKAGEVSVDGNAVTSYSREWLRAHMGIVSQVKPTC